jgi:Ca2+-binding EF-hand superfamily protein
MLALHINETVPEECLGRAFDALDLDKDGRISQEDLREVTGGRVSCEVWTELIQDQSLCNRQEITREEFFRLFG